MDKAIETSKEFVEDFNCKKCGNRFPEELIRILLKGGSVYCEHCGTENRLDIISPDISQVSDPIKDPLPKITRTPLSRQTGMVFPVPTPSAKPRKKASFLQIRKIFWKLRINFKRIINRSKFKSKKGRHRHRGGR